MKHRAALTLIEVLVAIAIAVVVLALTFTLGPRAIAAAKDRSCASNLRQVGKGIALYAADHDDAFPSALLSLPEQAPSFKRALGEYGVADEIFYCPRDPDARTSQFAEFGVYEHSSYGYGSLWLLIVIASKRGQVVRLTNPALYPELPDGIPDLTLLADNSRVFENTEAGGYIRRTAHGDRWNVLRHDLSVANLPVDQP
ncbi:MAG: type II secretion system protein [Fimbriimonadaceae bacterium]